MKLTLRVTDYMAGFSICDLNLHACYKILAVLLGSLAIMLYMRKISSCRKEMLKASPSACTCAPVNVVIAEDY